MKKQYIKPELMVEVLETVEMIATSVVIDDTPGSEHMSIGRDGRRGQWGNLWFTED